MSATLNKIGNMRKSIIKLLGNRIAAERRRQKMSQEELAELANVHRTYIGTVERGETNMTIENVQKIANALNISLERLFKNL